MNSKKAGIGFPNFASWLVVLPLAFASGCATKDSSYTEKGIVEGFQGGFKCGPLFVVCAPAMMVAGGIAGGVFDSTEARKKSAPAQIPEYPSKPPTFPEAMVGDRLDWLGPVDDDDDLPKGAMFLVTQSVRTEAADSGRPKSASALVLVEYDRTTRYGELSYIGKTSTDCATETISIHSWETYDDRMGKGSRVRGWVLPPMTVAKPPGTLGSAIRAICAKAYWGAVGPRMASGTADRGSNPSGDGTPGRP